MLLRIRNMVVAACALVACGPTPADGSVSTGAQTASEDSSSSQPISGDTSGAQTSTATSLSTSTGTADTGASSSSSTGTPAHCVPNDDVVELDVTLEALDADPNKISTSTREICTVTATTRRGAQLDCPEVGAVDISFKGLDGLDLRLLPDEVVLDFIKSTGFIDYPEQLRASMADSDGSLLLAYAGASNSLGFGIADNPWLAPLSIGRRVLDCPPDNFWGSECTLARIEVNAPEGSVTAVQAERVEIPGGWLFVLTVALGCDTSQGSAASPTQFGIVHESLLPPS